jgi:DNA-binding HxlR family transcriptional regulator
MGFAQVTALFRRKRSVEILALLDDETELNFSEIVDQIPSSSDTISNTLDVLDEYGLVERDQRHTNDVRYRITVEGRSVLKSIEDIRSTIGKE